MAIDRRRQNVGVKPGWLCLGLGLVILALTLGWPIVAAASQDRSPHADATQLCLTAAAQAADAEDVPLDVLLSVALVESGRDMGAGLAPWPWALHMQGRGHWPAHPSDALALAQAARATGVTNIDLGCFQINLHWHGAHFASMDAMLDPATNARYAARLLRGHFDRLGDWTSAVGAYHSRTPDLAAAYLARVARVTPHVADLVRVTGKPEPWREQRPPLRQVQPATAGAIALYLATEIRPLLDLRTVRP